MKDEETPPTAAERAAATMAAAAEAAAAEASAAAAEAEDSEHTALLAADVQRAAEPWESSAEGEPEALAAYGMGERKGRQPRTPSPAPMMRSLAAASAPAKGSVENAAAEDIFLDDVSTFGKAPSRSCQWLRCLPVLFLMLLVLYINLVYVAFHCLPQLQIGRPPALRDARRFQKGSYELIAFATLTFLFLLSYWLAVTTPAGSIPKTDQWSFKEDGSEQPGTTTVIETKKSGGRRACKWCCQWKPDRAHHCRVCRSCVLKMDHHCPWIFNCVGWGNHKFFMLALLWGAILAVFVAVTMLVSVKRAIKSEEASFERVFMLLFAETLDIFLGALISGFLVFHSYLVSNAVTTIEFCEKQFRKSPFDTPPEVTWSHGFRKNFTDAFGPDPLLWFFPVDNRLGDGTSFTPGSMLYYDPAHLETRITRAITASRRYKGFDPIVDPES